MKLRVQALRIGTVALACVPLEPFGRTGAKVKKRSPAKFTLFWGYSNGYFGYIPVAGEFPKGGYGVRTSPYPPDAAAELERAGGERALELGGRAQPVAMTQRLPSTGAQAARRGYQGDGLV